MTKLYHVHHQYHIDFLILVCNRRWFQARFRGPLRWLGEYATNSILMKSFGAWATRGFKQ